MIEDRLRALYGEAARTPMSAHPSEDLMVGLSAGWLSAGDRDALVSHVERCGECAALVQHLARCADCGGEVGVAPPSRIVRFPARWVALGGSLAAAAGLAWVLVRPIPPIPQSVDMLRGGAPGLVALEPSGRLAALPSTFRWQTIAEAASYRVVVLDVRGEHVWTSPETGGTALPWPDDLRLDPGTYAWQVVARIRDVAEPMASPMTIFEIR